MKRMRILKTSECLAVMVLAGLFLYAGVIKIVDTRQLYQDIQSYRILPDLLAWWSAHYLPWLEVITALGLLFSRFRFASAAILGALILTFTAALLSAWVRGLDITCGCFGSGGEINRYGWWLTRDLGLLAMAVFVLWNSRYGNSVACNTVAREDSLGL